MEKATKKSSQNDFVHLHLHSDYSLLESAVQLKPLAKKLVDLEMKACAITDYGNMFGAISFYNRLKENGIKPIIGYEAHLIFGDRFQKGAPLGAGELPFYNLVLLAVDLVGYHNLAVLASKAYTEGFHFKPRIDLDLLAKHSKGLIGLSSGFKGAVWHFLHHENEERSLKCAKQFEEIFGKGKFFIEIQDHGLPDEKKIRKPLIALAKKAEIELVATNDVHYLNSDDARAHELLYCIGEGKTINDSTRTILGGDKFYLRSAEEMWQLFGKELPRAVSNTMRISEMCNFVLPKAEENLRLPNFPIPKSSHCKTTDEFFEKVVMEGFKTRKHELWDKQIADGRLKYDLGVYRERIDREIKTIERMNYAGYFLIVWDFIRYAKERGIPVGPGRGSAAGSLVAFCLGVTDVDPIQYDLLFERFLNPERISMPDIDIDFCVRGRGQVIEHVLETYGRDSVCQIITFGTMASRAAIKDVGRALEMPYGDVEKISKLIPPPVRGRNVSISQALEQVPELKKEVSSNPAVRLLVDHALRLEGCARHSSVHAAGVVISPQPLHELVPIAISPKNELTSQYSMTDLEKVGMLKMDFLALTTLTIISDCLKQIKEKIGDEIDWAKISFSDEKTMELFAHGHNHAIFQFESAGMQEICRRLKPRDLEDLAALNALYRPGPIDGGMIDDFIERHRGERQVSYIVPEMEPILDRTFGILVYQEQIMQLAQTLAGYSLGEADIMRRAMGKKNRAEMSEQRAKFVKGAIERKIPKKKAEEIFKLMEQFADYGFNRSHSVAYAYLAFQTAYLKAHYPAFFYASVLSNESDDSAKIYKYSTEIRSAGLTLLPPDVNESDAGFTPLTNAVRFGLSAIKGIGATSVNAITEARENGGRLASLFDFAMRIDPHSINRRGLESLICAGAFDSLMGDGVTANQWRAQLFAAIDSALSLSQRALHDRTSGQTSLFGDHQANVTGENFGAQLPEVEAWSSKKLSQEEKKAVGFYLSHHPLDNHQSTLASLGVNPIADNVGVSPGSSLRVAGVVSDVQVRYSKKGNRFCVFRLEDQTQGIKCLAWSEAYSKFSSCIADDAAILVTGKVESVDQNDITIVLESALKLDEAIQTKAKKALITFREDALDPVSLNKLFDLMLTNSGECEVEFEVRLNNDVAVRLDSPAYRIRGSQQIEDEFVRNGGKVSWSLGERT